MISGIDAATLREQSRSYEAWRHLAPRSVTPVLRDAGEDIGSSVDGENIGPGVGLKMAGADPLGRWAYNARGFYQTERLWGDASIETGLLPGTPSLSVFNRPTETVRETGGGTSRLRAFELRGVGLGARQRLVLENNVYTTTLTARLAGQYRQSRPITTGGEAEGSFTDRATVRSDLTLNYRVQKNVRDLVPNTGVRLNASAEADVFAAGDIPSRYLQQTVDVFWPLLSEYNVGLRTSASFLTQSRRSLFDVQSFVPRGYRGLGEALPGSGNYLRLGAKYTQPLWHIDTGSVMLPVAVDALYGYGLGQAQYRIEGGPGPALGERRASVGAGLGLQLRPFGRISLNLEVGVSYRIDAHGENRWVPHVR